MPIIIKVRNNSSFINKKLDKEIYQSFKHKLGFTPENAQFMIENTGNGQWDGRISTVCAGKRWCKCAVKKEGIHFPTGLLGLAKEFFEENKISVKFVDERIKPKENIDLSLNKDIEDRDYQKRAVKKCIKAGRGLVQAATGSGKTLLAAQLIEKFKVEPFIFVVPSLDLLEQSKSEFENFLIENDQKLKVGYIGGGHCDIQKINVITQQTAVRALGHKYVKADEEDKKEKESKEVKDNYPEIKNLIESAKGIIIDESQHAASETVQAISDHAYNAYYRFGLSATVFRDKGDDLLIKACFGKMLVNITASELIEKGYLVQPTIYIIPVKNMWGAVAGHTYSEVYKKAISENALRNKWIADIATKMYEKNRNVLVLVKNIDHGKLLENLIPHSTFIYGKTSKKKRKEYLESMRNKEKRITIGSVIYDEGINVKALDCLICAGSGKSVTRALQRIGRVIRTYKEDGYEKKDAIVIDFLDYCKYLLSHSKKRIKIYQSEPKFNIEMLNIDKKSN